VQPAEASASDFILLIKPRAKRRSVFGPFALFLPFSTAILVDDSQEKERLRSQIRAV
jgi:hypothetical protein